MTVPALPGCAAGWKSRECPSRRFIKPSNQALSVNLSWAKELELARQNRIPNRYVIRLLDIAAYHQVSIHLTVDSCYPASFYEELLQKNGVTWDSLGVSCETGKSKTQMAEALHLEKFGAVSADFNGFLRPLVRRGAKGYLLPGAGPAHEGRPPIPGFPRISRSLMTMCAAPGCFPAGNGRLSSMNWDTSVPAPWCTAYCFPKRGCAFVMGAAIPWWPCWQAPIRFAPSKGPRRSPSNSHPRVGYRPGGFPGIFEIPAKEQSPGPRSRWFPWRRLCRGGFPAGLPLWGRTQRPLRRHPGFLSGIHPVYRLFPPFPWKMLCGCIARGQRNMERLLAEREISANTTVSV